MTLTDDTGWREILTDGYPPSPKSAMNLDEYWVFDGTAVFMAFYDPLTSKWTNCDCWEDFDRSVTHWMPLSKPQPPQEPNA